MSGDRNGKALVEHYAAIVRERSVKRQLQEASLAFARACGNGHSPQEIMAESSKLFRLSMSIDPDAMKRVDTTANVMLQLQQEILAQSGRTIRTFIPEIDRVTGGILPGEVMTVIARPRVGKSAFASNVAVDNARSGVKVAFLSLEMPRTQALVRMMQQALDMSQREVEQAAAAKWSTLGPQQLEALRPLRENIAIGDRVRGGIESLDSGLNEIEGILGGPPRLIVIDYLGLISTGGRNTSLYQRVSEAAIEVKALAKRRDAAIILLSQAGRDQDEQRSDGAARLGLDAARDSGQVEEAADFILTMWRPELNKKLNPVQKLECARLMEMSLVKNRRGSEADIRLRFDRERTLRLYPWGE